MDTDTIVAAMRSPGGASAALLRAARRGSVSLVASVPLCLEYESVCSRAEHVAAAGVVGADMEVFLDAVVALVDQVGLWFSWRPS